MRSRLKYESIQAGETDWIGAPSRAFLNQGPIRTVIYCHGSGGSTVKVTAGQEFQLMKDLAADRVSIIGDFGFEAWGNDTAVAKVHAAVLYARANLGSVGPVALIGTSMGMLTCCNYARAHPTEVSAIAGIIPAVDIQNLIDIYPAAEAGINAAYSPAYDDAIHRIHSPIHMAEDDLLTSGLKIKIWSLPSDTLATPATHDAFVAARPQTEMVDITAPGVYHGAIAVEAVREEVITWLKENAHG